MKQSPLYAVIGTRAQLIKMAPVLREIQDLGLEYIFIYTAQHRETIEELLHEFGVKKPDIDMTHYFKQEAKTLQLFFGWMFKMALILLFKRKEIIDTSGGILMTHGDTTTTVWGAILGKMTGNRVMHIESGLRSFNIFEPFPEEINRLITFRFTDIFVCAGEWAVNNVSKYRGQIINTKVNTLYDATQLAILKKNRYKDNIPKKKFVVVSIHRFENLFNRSRLNLIFEILSAISENFLTIFVLHPATKKQLEKHSLYDNLNRSKNIELRPRMSYIEFINLLDSSEFVITDGGSNQEELSYLGKPTLLLRNATERKEGLDKNIQLIGLDKKAIIKFTKNYHEFITENSMGKEHLPSREIASYLKNNL